MRLRHYSHEPVLAVRSADQGERDFKPRGFWISDDDCEDNWRAWCTAESFSLGSLACVHDVELARGANVLFLRSAADIDAFSRAYGGDYDFMPAHLRSIRIVRWAAVASKYDGIIITPYIWERRLSDNADWYYSWDCASGCIWNAGAIASVRLAESRAA